MQNELDFQWSKCIIFKRNLNITLSFSKKLQFCGNTLTARAIINNSEAVFFPRRQ